jgi:hypothetical protein
MQFEKRFTARRMAQEYLGQYKALVRPDAGKTHFGVPAATAQSSARQPDPNGADDPNCHS